MKTHFFVLGCLCSCVFAAIFAHGAATTPSQSRQEAATATHNFSRDTKIWVSNFELDAGDVKTDKGGIVGEVRPGILERPSKRCERDPECQSKKIVDLMAKSIVEDLQKAGYKAQRLMPGDAQPAMGAWVQGVFTEVDEGNRRRRAIVGFGSGEAKMDLYVTLTDLAAPQKPMYEVANNENSGKKIGAVITMNPYVAAAKFVMEKQAPEKTVKKTASEIAKEVEHHMQ
ncbi:MAG: DUF4410 domain-containing protein [Acidobacteria bacterium]|nr:DUF4410 domain-containing protein [Acidobacteriota bacterium]